MAFKINGSDVINAAKQYSGTANVSVTDSIVISNNDSLDAVSGSAAGYTFSDGTVAIGEDGLAFSDMTLRDASIEITGPLFQGTISGYTSGGQSPTYTTIDKFPFSTDSNASDVGDLTQARRFPLAGQSSSESGYTSGGASPTTATTLFNTIDKFPFAADGNATDVGDLSQVRIDHAGHSSQNHGYTSGGRGAYSPNFVPTYRNTIDKFPFATDSNSTDVGDLIAPKAFLTGQSSRTHGYASGGVPPSNAPGNVIEKFAFASDANSTDVGDLTNGRSKFAGQSSTTHGYVTSGNQTAINKFSFASDGNATTVGSVLPAGGQYNSVGQSSTTNGYNTGGTSTYGLDIQKFPFAADGNATDVGDLTQGRYGSAGQQV